MDQVVLSIQLKLRSYIVTLPPAEQASMGGVIVHRVEGEDTFVDVPGLGFIRVNQEPLCLYVREYGWPASWLRLLSGLSLKRWSIE